MEAALENGKVQNATAKDAKSAKEIRGGVTTKQTKGTKRNQV
jgi:hypothetical protein